MNITVVTLFDEAIADWARPIAEQKRQYCAKHGYKFICHEQVLDASASAHYSKMPAILDAFNDESAEWVFWSDADSIIMDHEQKLEPFIDPNFFLIMPTDITGHSTSNFFIRNSEWARQLVEEWRDFRPRYDKTPYEQMTLGFILRSKNWLLHRVSLAGDAFNGHPLQKKRQFIIHLGGWHNYRRRKYVANFMNPKISYAQYGEDLFVAEFFKGRTGMFLEIGALDGVKDSNCRKLAEMGWSGVAIEPNPALFVKLMKNYNGFDVHPICALVTGEPGIRTLHLNNDGLSTTCPEVFGDFLKNHKDVHFTGSCFAPCVTPDHIAKRFGNHFDFVSVDAEGMDIEIVRASKDLLKHTQLLCIETQKPGQGHSHDYSQLWNHALAETGFTHVLHTTKGNTLLKRP